MTALPEPARPSRLKAAVALLVTTLCWGSTVPFTADLLNDFDPLLLAPARYGMAVPILLLASLLVDGRTPWPRYLPIGKALMLGGSVAIFVTLVSFGVYYSDPITAIAIFALAPVIALAMSWLADRQRISGAHLLAVALAVTGGVIAAIFKPGSVQSLGFRGGEFLLILGMICWIWYSMKAQLWLTPIGFTQVRLTFVSSTVAFGWLVIFYGVGVSAGLAAPPPASPSLLSVTELFWMALGPTAIGVALWNYGTAMLGVAVSMLYVNLSPIVSVVISMVLFGADTTPMQIFGGALVLAGVVWIQLHNLRGGVRTQRQADA